MKKEKEEMTPLSVGIREAQQATGISAVTLRRMIKTGRLRAARIGRRLVIPTSELERITRPGAVSETEK